jgi:uncharacterized protein YcbX
VSRVAALFRYPVKGFAREECAALQVLPGGRIAGDRVLALRFNDSATPDDAWGTKMECIALINTPALAPLRIEYDHEALRLRIRNNDEALFDGVLDVDGRKRFAAAIERYVLATPENPLSGHPKRLPLRVIGNGVTARYQDREPGYVTLHGRSSVDAFAAAIGQAPDVTEKRFRSNVAIDGLDAWSEQSWPGRTLRIGDVAFSAVNPVTRCLATHAHPLTGQRDVPVMQALVKVFPAQRPTFAILMTSDRGGSIRVGDKVELEPGLQSHRR